MPSSPHANITPETMLMLTGRDDVYLTGRDAGRVRAALERVPHPQAHLHGYILDVGDDTSVAAFADEIRTRHGGVDIVFSNAAARLTPGTPSAELVGRFVNTNNLGASRMLRAFGPSVRPGGRLLVVASDFGSLRLLPRHLQGRFDTETMTLDDVDAVMLVWRDAVVHERDAEEGWPNWINIPSKVGKGRRNAGPGTRPPCSRHTRWNPGRRVPRAHRHICVATLVRRHERRADPRASRRRPTAPRARPGCGCPSVWPAHTVRQDRPMALKHAADSRPGHRSGSNRSGSNRSGAS